MSAQLKRLLIVLDNMESMHLWSGQWPTICLIGQRARYSVCWWCVNRPMSGYLCEKLKGKTQEKIRDKVCSDKSLPNLVLCSLLVWFRERIVKILVGTRLNVIWVCWVGIDHWGLCLNVMTNHLGKHVFLLLKLKLTWLSVTNDTVNEIIS